jgi:hypothetical protein
MPLDHDPEHPVERATEPAALLGYLRQSIPYGELPTRRGEIERRVVRRAWADEGFRHRLLVDPKAALAEELGVSLPARLEVTVVEERPDLMCIVIPVDLSGIEERDSRAATGLPARRDPRVDP